MITTGTGRDQAPYHESNKDFEQKSTKTFPTEVASQHVLSMHENLRSFYQSLGFANLEVRLDTPRTPMDFTLSVASPSIDAKRIRQE